MRGPLSSFTRGHKNGDNVPNGNALKVKPIFHCDAKPFALGTFASPDANIPTCWYLLR